MGYLVLARKYRPQRFADVIEQDHVTRTLCNAITAGRLAHAILFAGPRGTGKTTIARILAKAMNCVQGPSPDPCNQCRSCREITAGSAADVFEIDGASNTGVEQVRELRENLKYMPAHSPYKIYIIDEVHMLSVAAFNALLKTLEEPPPHVLFFFATTEPHKIPATILSRCQRHDLRRVPTRAIAAHLETLCQSEGRRVPMESLEMIAREADGCLRDALSLLDQVLAAAQGEVDAGLVHDTLGTLDRQRLMNLAGAILEKNLPAVLDAVDDAYNQGLDLKKLYQDLCQQFRHMLVIRSVEKPEALVDLPAFEISVIGSQVAGLSAAQLSQTLDVLLREEAFVRLAPQPRLALETVLVRMTQVPPPLTIDALVAKLDKLQTRLPSGAEAPGEDSGETEARDAVKAPDESIEARLFGAIAERHPKLSGALPLCRVAALDDRRITIEVRGNGFQTDLMRRDRHAIETVCREVLGRDIEVTLDAEVQEAAENARKHQHRNLVKQEAIQHPLVAEAIEIFDGRVVDVHSLEGEPP
jgi:DNA polymerase-3 subunit gamma/tau